MIIVKIRVRTICTSPTKFLCVFVFPMNLESRDCLKYLASWVGQHSVLGLTVRENTQNCACWHWTTFSASILWKAGLQRGGRQGGQIAQGLVLWGASDCKGLIPKNSSKCLKGLNPEWNSYWSIGNNVKLGGGGGASLWMTTLLRPPVASWRPGEKHRQHMLDRSNLCGFNVSWVIVIYQDLNFLSFDDDKPHS